MKHLAIFLFSVCCLAGAAPATLPAAELPPPDKFQITLEFDKESYTLGELILAHYCVENTGDKPFNVGSGGDYRGTVRALRFSVTVENEKGVACADPYPSAGQLCMGGISGPMEVKPGEKWFGSIRLHMYARIERGGKYKVTVSHDLGWGYNPKVSRVALAFITVAFPTPADAKNVIEAACKAPKDNGWTVGERRTVFKDLTPAIFPEYLPLLAELVRNGDQEALAAIGVTPTPDSTRALIELAESADPKLARQAILILNRRLPDPRWNKQLGPQGPFQEMFSMHQERKELSVRAWKDEFRDRTRAIGTKYLASKVNDGIVIGAYIIQCIGTKDDAATLKRALRSGLDNALTDKPEEGTYPRPRGACEELMRAAQALTRRDMQVDPSPVEVEDVAIYLNTFGKSVKKVEDAERPKFWDGHIEEWLGNSNPMIRLYALCSLPVKIPERLVKIVSERIQDSDPDVQVRACQCAEANPGSLMKGAALQAFTSSNDQWVRRQAFAAAVACGARYEALLIAADRIDNDNPSEGLSWIIEGSIDEQTRGPSRVPPTAAETTGLKERWKQFLQKHETEIRANKRFVLGEPDLDPKLFPGIVFVRKDGSRWPQDQEK